MGQELLTLMNLVSALYFDNMAEDTNSFVREEAQLSLGEMKYDPDGSMSIGSVDAAMEGLKNTVEWMMTYTDGKFDREVLLSRLGVNLDLDNVYLTKAAKDLDVTVKAEDARRKSNQILSGLRSDRKREALKKLVSIANAKVNFSDDHLDHDAFMSELTEKMAELGGVSEDSALPGFVNSVDFDKLDELQASLTKGLETISKEMVLDTGFQGLNDITGVGGIPRGAFGNIGALTHHYKSGMLIDLALNIPRYNKPWMWDPKKKPLILRISFENTIEQDITIIYRKYYGLMNGSSLDPEAKIDVVKAAKELKEYFNSKGYKFAIENYDPNNFSIHNLFSVMDRWIADGYEIHLCTVDYLTQIAHNTMADSDEKKIQRTTEMARNYAYPKGIALMTGHQLTPGEAGALFTESPGQFTRKMACGRYYMHCKAFSTKLDLEFFTAVIEHIDGIKYLMVSGGKNRYNTEVSIAKKTYCQPFEPGGGIIPDSGEGEPSRALRKLPSLNTVVAGAEW